MLFSVGPGEIYVFPYRGQEAYILVHFFGWCLGSTVIGLGGGFRRRVSEFWELFFGRRQSRTLLTFSVRW